MSSPSQQIAEVIGEGTYGCIHKPSLKCKDKQLNYDGKISKVAFDDEAKDEMKEYDVIDNIDKTRQFHLGKPELCKFDTQNKNNVLSLKRCNNELFNSPSHMDDLSLMVMKNGGVDLEKFIDTMKTQPVNEENIHTVEVALLEFHRIFMGLKSFITNGIVHHDLKPQNIVFDKETNRMNFIDFGIMTNEDKIINESRNSNYNLSIIHWSFPLEMLFYNAEYYKSFLRQKQKRSVTHKLIIENPYTLKPFLTFILDATNENFKQNLRNYFEEAFNTFLENYNENKYDEFLNTSIKTIDIYGTGIACLYFCNNLKKFIGEELHLQLYDLFYKMVRPNFNKRIQIDELISEYEDILNRSGLLKKHGKVIENHMLVDEPKNAMVLDEIIDKIKKSDIILSDDARKTMTTRACELLKKHKQSFITQSLPNVKLNITKSTVGKKTFKTRRPATVGTLKIKSNKPNINTQKPPSKPPSKSLMSSVRLSSTPR